MNGYPPGVTGMEPQIAGCDEFESTCPECGEIDLLFYGDKWEATSECPTCGEVIIYPHSLAESIEAEARADAVRDGDA